MAITKVAQYQTAPTTLANGYTAQNNHLQAFINQVTAQAFILTDPVGTAVPTIKGGCYIADGGTLYMVDAGSDYAILGTAVDGNNYIKMSIVGDTLTATWIQNITGYAYNNVYGYLASGTDILLPYLIVKASAVYTKYRNDIISPAYKMNQNVRTTDSPTFASVNTGHGANELYAMNQDVETTDAVAFATVNTGQGANELYGMNQNVRTTDSPTFANVYSKVNGAEFYTGGAKKTIKIEGMFTGAAWFNYLAQYVYTYDTEVNASGYITLSDSTRLIVSSVYKGFTSVTIYGTNGGAGANEVTLTNSDGTGYMGSINL